MDQPGIFHYTSLEAYLGRYCQYRKAMNPSFSYAVWAKRIGVKSPATLHMVTNGKRSPGKGLVSKLTKEMALNADECRYFEILVGLKKHKNHLAPSLDLMKALEEQHPDKGFKLVEHEEFRMISNWYCWALLDMVSLKGFKEDPHWLSRKMEFDVSAENVREALIAMERLKLVGRDRNGKLVRTTRPLKTSSDKASEAIKKFHSQVLKNATDSIYKHHVDERNFEALTVSMSASKMPEAKKMIRQFIDDFCRKFDDPRANKVHQMELVLFPVTQNLKER
ncbi:MAG: DUF4423 domain-containing protein [Bdellovibrionaceae bacterium]|nr:DUF4423 domain-containing protein [Pseudobdellovibrionaceae bacterium]